MITPLLEKALLTGEGVYKTFNHAFSMFGAITFPKDSVIVITDIIWYPFINQPKNLPVGGRGGFTWEEFFKYNEYELKLQSPKGKTRYMFRNSIDFTLVDPTVRINLQSNIVPSVLYQSVLMQPRKPIVLNTFLVHSEKLSITIARNARRDFKTTTGSVTNFAGELIPPNGIKTMPIALEVQMTNATGNTDSYQPAGTEIDGITVSPQYTNEYKNGYDALSLGGSYNSELSFPDQSSAGNINNRESNNYPLVTIGYVQLNSNFSQKLENY